MKTVIDTLREQAVMHATNASRLCRIAAETQEQEMLGLISRDEAVARTAELINKAMDHCQQALRVNEFLGRFKRTAPQFESRPTDE